MDAGDMADVGLSGTPMDAVQRLAGVASRAGLDGVVCSANELSGVRAQYPEPFLCVTPGIRPNPTLGNDDDQKRVTTAADAIRDGASFLVVGRPITRAAEPMQVVEALLADCGVVTPS